MLEELLNIIYEAEKLISQQKEQYQNKSIQLMTQSFQELEEINEKIYQHFQDDHKR